MNTLMLMGLCGGSFACFNCGFYFVQWRADRRYRFIGDHGRASLNRAIVNLGLALLFATAYLTGRAML